MTFHDIEIWSLVGLNVWTSLMQRHQRFSHSFPSGFFLWNTFPRLTLIYSHCFNVKNFSSMRYRQVTTVPTHCAHPHQRISVRDGLFWIFIPVVTRSYGPADVTSCDKLWPWPGQPILLCMLIDIPGIDLKTNVSLRSISVLFWTLACLGTNDAHGYFYSPCTTHTW